jgi:hypothetical protein
VGHASRGDLSFRPAVPVIWGDTPPFVESALRTLEAGRPTVAGDGESAPARVRIGAVLHPAVRLAFTNGAGFLQHGDRPAAQRPDLGPSFLEHQH